MLNKNEEMKAQRGYTDENSFVRNDGTEVLKGDDWKRRKLQLHHRSYGLCERLTVLGRKHVPACRGMGEEPHHIVKRHPYRDDRLNNLANLSHACHKAEDPRKPRFGEHKA